MKDLTIYNVLTSSDKKSIAKETNYSLNLVEKVLRKERFNEEISRLALKKAKINLISIIEWSNKNKIFPYRPIKISHIVNK